jgi:hypothetical protein
MRTLFGREVYIRLSEDGTHFISTVKYGKFFTRTKQLALKCEPAPEGLEDHSLAPVRKRFSYWPVDEG